MSSDGRPRVDELLAAARAAGLVDLETSQPLSGPWKIEAGCGPAFIDLCDASGVEVLSRSRVEARLAVGGASVSVLARRWDVRDVTVVLAGRLLDWDATLRAGRTPVDLARDDALAGLAAVRARSWPELVRALLPNPASRLRSPLTDVVARVSAVAFEDGEFGSRPVPVSPMAETLGVLLAGAYQESGMSSRVFVSVYASPQLAYLAQVACARSELLATARVLEGPSRAPIDARRAPAVRPAPPRGVSPLDR